MSAARRSLLTATAAGTLLGALWFVPSANATQDVPTPSGSMPASAPAGTTATRISTESATAPDPESDGDQTLLADTGSIDTTPYLVGGTLFLGLGAGFVAYSVRRERTMAY
ncbi:LPXTG cell wall anchor domain-containing protein [Streptomyces sp. NPDC060027]|uniref:LPXTG cell wall anchor domain-containing protein n=1 Tax=Streptomyces sp. NPDC060027 TaxID=3347040 RepID=UPI0036C11EA0